MHGVSVNAVVAALVATVMLFESCMEAEMERGKKQGSRNRGGEERGQRQVGERTGNSGLLLYNNAFDVRNSVFLRILLILICVQPFIP